MSTAGAVCNLPIESVSLMVNTIDSKKYKHGEYEQKTKRLL